jgi:YceI-like domain
MKTFDQSSAVCNVYTFKEGLLSAFGHDLCLNVTSFVIEIADDASFINARFDAGSLRAGCAVVKGIQRDILKESEKKEIEHNIFYDVLVAHTFTEILLSSTSVLREDSGYAVNGRLALHGRTREISFTVRKDGSNCSADIWLHLPDFGIKPFSAPFGIMKIKPDILVRLILPSSPFEELFQNEAVKEEYHDHA